MGRSSKRKARIRARRMLKAVVGAWVASFVLAYEEPTLSEQFGAEYEAYRQAVPRWLPRRRARVR